MVVTEEVLNSFTFDTPVECHLSPLFKSLVLDSLYTGGAEPRTERTDCMVTGGTDLVPPGLSGHRGLRVLSTEPLVIGGINVPRPVLRCTASLSTSIVCPCGRRDRRNTRRLTDTPAPLQRTEETKSRRNK